MLRQDYLLFLPSSRDDGEEDLYGAEDSLGLLGRAGIRDDLARYLIVPSVL